MIKLIIYFLNTCKAVTFLFGVFLFFIIQNSSLWAQTLLRVQDCASDIPIENMIITNQNQEFQYNTNAEGNCLLPASLVGDTLLLSKLGYVSKLMILSAKEMKICLSPNIIYLEDVKVNSKAINYYDTLMMLREKNLTQFVKNDTTLFYKFSYKSVDESLNRNIDSAFGIYYIDYKNYKFPISMFNSKGSQIAHFEYGANTVEYSIVQLESIHPLDISMMFALFNLMDRSSFYDWKSIKRNKEIINYEQLPNSKNIFTTYLNNELSKIFYFDAEDNIEKIVYFVPRERQGRIKDSIQRKITVYYNTYFPKMATKLEQSFSVKDNNWTYHTSLILNLTADKKMTLVQKKDKSLKFFPLSGMMRSFYEGWQNINKDIQSGNVIRLDGKSKK